MDSRIMAKPEVDLAQLACHEQTCHMLSGGKGECEVGQVGWWVAEWLERRLVGYLSNGARGHAHLPRKGIELRFQLHLGPRRQNVEVEGDVDILHLGPATFRAPGP